MPPRKRFYAILRGRETGIFNSWQEVEAHVKGFKGAIHHSFKTLEDALAYMNSSGTPTSTRVQPTPQETYFSCDSDAERDEVKDAHASYVNLLPKDMPSRVPDYTSIASTDKTPTPLSPLFDTNAHASYVNLLPKDIPSRVPDAMRF